MSISIEDNPMVWVIVQTVDGVEQFVGQHNPDLVVMDVMMPEMDGFETLEMLREISTVPVEQLIPNDRVTSQLLNHLNVIHRVHGMTKS